MRILFICRHNRFRSKVAEAIFNKIDSGKNEARSRGLFIDINSANSLREIMMEKGFPIVDVKSREVSVEDVEWADKIAIVANIENSVNRNTFFSEFPICKILKTSTQIDRIIHNVNPEMFPSEKTETWEISDTDEGDLIGIKE
ncbi:MAG: hypothetical protein AABX65_01665 [Nanoarchaeota archaeon]